MEQVQNQSSRKISYVFIMKTPFHFLFFERILTTTTLVDDGILLLINKNLESRLEKFRLKYPHHIDAEVLPDVEFYVSRLLRNPVLEWWRLRGKVQTISQFLMKVLAKYSIPKTLYIFNDKDVLTQLYIRKVKKICPPKIIAIEEGTSFYKDEKRSDFLYKVAYQLVSPVVLGFPYHYVNTYGSSKFVDEVYLRFPEHLPKNKELRKKKITKVGLNQKKITVDTRSRSILLLSSPLSEYFVLTNGLEKRIYHDLLQFGNQNNFKVFLKPHPKEPLEKYSGFGANVEGINNLIPLEDIELRHFRTIISYASSAILDVVDRNYPVNNIITINPYKDKLSLESIYKKTNYISVYSNKKLVDYEIIRRFLIGSLMKVLFEMN